MEDFKKYLRYYDDFPRKGVKFVDLMPLFEERLEDLGPYMYDMANDIFDSETNGMFYLGGIESRGFILAAAMACNGRYVAPFVPIRKPGKLPGAVESIDFQTEYSVDTLEMQISPAPKKRPIVLIDDVAATLGTLRAAGKLAEAAGYDVLGAAVVCDLPAIHDGELPFPLVSLMELD
jgi:adenine phosphoribosyltransferase